MALELATDYAPAAPVTYRAGGPPALDQLHGAMQEREQQGRLTPHDRCVGEALAHVLVGGTAKAGESLTEDDLYALERESFLKLVQTPATQARIAHTLKTGQPLRN